MGFFDDLPVPRPHYRPRRWHGPWEPPATEFPGIAPINTLQFEGSGQAAIALTGISAYTAGFEIFITHRIRPDTHSTARDPTPDAPGAAPAALRSFHLGLQFSDGSKAISGIPYFGPGPDSEPAGPILRPLGGGDTQFSRWWAWPLPPGGSLEFVCEWLQFGITETRIGIDAQLILDAARRSVQLWPENGG
ncbi:MAG TPA: hypothetical protein VIY52_30735 [Streptosporangiaceae bacterium]